MATDDENPFVKQAAEILRGLMEGHTSMPGTLEHSVSVQTDIAALTTDPYAAHPDFKVVVILKMQCTCDGSTERNIVLSPEQCIGTIHVLSAAFMQARQVADQIKGGADPRQWMG